ncbi:MAG TPA: RNA polymerase sigma factor, partial [Flavitalea sp.]|nr:RNA polymerase sigma factor [Flavitalea sp.]
MTSSNKKARPFSDEELIRSIRSNEHLDDAVRFLYRAHFESISSLILYNKGTRQDAEDVFQEIVVSFIEIVQKDKFRGASSIKTFLFSMARNTWLNQLKKNDRTAIRELRYQKGEEQHETDVTEHIAEMEIKRQLQAIMEKLGEPCRKVLTLFYYEELSMLEMLQHLP